jgi:hypothetical protein
MTELPAGCIDGAVYTARSANFTSSLRFVTVTPGEIFDVSKTVRLETELLLVV